MAKKTAPAPDQDKPTAPATNTGAPDDQAPAGTDQDSSKDTTSIDDQVHHINDDINGLEHDIGELTHLLVRAVRDGFRRAGRAWSIAPQVVAKAEFSPEQIDALKAEPNLLVTEVSQPVAPSAQADA